MPRKRSRPRRVKPKVVRQRITAQRPLPGSKVPREGKGSPSCQIDRHAWLKNSRFRDVRLRLLTDPGMRLAWREIEQRLGTLGVKSDDRHPYDQFWRELQYALARAHRPLEPRSKICERLRRISVAARELAEEIGESPLDLLAYEYWPAELAHARWEQFGPEARSEMAYRQSRGALWPSMTDLLKELGGRAAQQADVLRQTPRLVDRDTRDRAPNYVIRHLHAYYFQPVLGRHMDGTLARIATVIFERPFTKVSVRLARGAWKPRHQSCRSPV